MAELDPLLAALIGKLPPQAPFAGEQRAAWLKMMGMAFDVVYGVAEDMPNFLGAPAPRAVSAPVAALPAAAAPRRHAAYKFYIDLAGNALNDQDVPVLREDIPAETEIFDTRPITSDFRDVDGIVWADGQHGTLGLAPGCSFCGPG